MGKILLPYMYYKIFHMQNVKVFILYNINPYVDVQSEMSHNFEHEFLRIGRNND